MIRPCEAPSDVDGLDELLLADREHLAADDARDVGPVGGDDDRDDDRQARLQQAAEAAVLARARRREAEAEQQHREREHDVDHARDQRVDPATEVRRRSCPSSRRSCTDRPVPMKATISDTWAPLSTREKMSRPIESTPIRCSLEGPVARPNNGSSAVRRRLVGRWRAERACGSAPRGSAVTINRTMKVRAASATLSCGSDARRAAAATARPPVRCPRRSCRWRGPRRAAGRWRLFRYSNSQPPRGWFRLPNFPNR